MYSKSSSSSSVSCNCNNNNECTLQMNKTPATMEIKKCKKDVNSNNARRIKTVDVKKEEVLAIRNRFPTKIPVIVERYQREVYLPQLDKNKFLVPQEITMAQFQIIIRNRIRTSPTQALYMLINNKTMVSLSLTISQVYAEHAETDGFLYVTYASQEVFG